MKIIGRKSDRGHSDMTAVTFLFGLFLYNGAITKDRYLLICADKGESDEHSPNEIDAVRLEDFE